MTALHIFLILIFIVFFLTFIYKNRKPQTEYIPRIIIQTWKTAHLTNPVHIKCQKKLLEIHRDFKYLYFDDKEVDNFIETRFPQYFDFFKRLDTRIQQIDFFRLCALYHHGGFYLDLDMYPIKNLAPLCSVNRFIIPVEHHLPSGKCQRFQKYGRYPDFDCKKRVTLGNYALASPAQNPELLTLIQTIVNDYVKVDRSKYHRLVHVYITTGPDKLTQVYSTNQHFANKIYLLPNNHSTAYFGNFAKHLAAGSWK